MRRQHADDVAPAAEERGVAEREQPAVAPDEVDGDGERSEQEVPAQPVDEERIAAEDWHSEQRQQQDRLDATPDRPRGDRSGEPSTRYLRTHPPHSWRERAPRRGGTFASIKWPYRLQASSGSMFGKLFARTYFPFWAWTRLIVCWR